MSLTKDHQSAIGQVFDRGYEVFNSPEKFNQWLTTSILNLDNQTPLSKLDTKKGAQRVLDIITRLERGIHS